MTLTIPQRETIVRQCGAGVPIQEIADEFEVSVATIVKVDRMEQRRQRIVRVAEPTPAPKPIDWKSARPAAEFYLPNDPCKFPLGNPKQEGFRFCGEWRLPGYPYCSVHCATSYRNFQCAEAAA